MVSKWSGVCCGKVAQQCMSGLTDIIIVVVFLYEPVDLRHFPVPLPDRVALGNLLFHDDIRVTGGSPVQPCNAGTVLGSTLYPRLQTCHEECPTPQWAATYVVPAIMRILQQRCTIHTV